jgi:aspartate/methionine/tyrosine aminotransferase
LMNASAAHATERMSVTALDHLHLFRNRARKLLAANRARLDRFLNSRRDLAVVNPGFGTIVFPRLARGDAEDFCKLLREKYETTVVPGRFFEMPQHFRLGIGGDTASLAAGLDRLCSALDDFKP